MINYTFIFICSIGLNLIASICSFKQQQQQQQDLTTTTTTTNNHHHHDNTKWYTLFVLKFLPIYLLGTITDWIQGPCMINLFSDYRYSIQEINVLWIAGYISAIVLGPIIGCLSDLHGRKRSIILFCIINCISSLTKFFKSYDILLFGRMLDGIAMSLFHTVFETWLIRAHTDANLDNKYLKRSFSCMNYCNHLVAIIGCYMSNIAVTMYPIMVPVSYLGISLYSGDTSHVGGYLGAYTIAFIPLFWCCMGAITKLEENNKGTSSNTDNDCDEILIHGYNAIKHSPIVRIYCMISTLFEGSIYIFILMWTRILISSNGISDIPFGTIFCTFMMSCMVGSCVFHIVSTSWKIEKILFYTLSMATISMIIVTLSNNNVTVKYLAMNVFEISIGIYYPLISMIKKFIIPETHRTTIYNFYRIPLYCIVTITIYYCNRTKPTAASGLCVILLLAAIGLLQSNRPGTTTTTTSTGATTKQQQEKTTSITPFELEELLK